MASLWRHSLGRLTACALAGGSAAAALAHNIKQTPAVCLESSSTFKSEGEDMKSRIQNFRSWAAGLGAQMNPLDIRETCEGRGLGLYPSTWAEQRHGAGWLANLQRLCGMERETVLATFPLETVVSTRLILQQPGLGQMYEKLIAAGTVDERTALMLFLVVEKLRAEESLLSPWLKLVPATFDTPLHFTESQLNELQGTNLHAASRVLSANLHKTWDKLKPVCQDLLQAAGHGQHEASFDDFLWAYSTFWSRAQSLPVPTGVNGEVSTQESIVPGLDFANHAMDHSCHWTLWGGQKGSGMPDRVSLVTAPGAGIRADEELCITYGNKSNEELLFLYGFAQETNASDMLMVKCPLPPVEQWDEVIRARLLYLLDQGLSSQLFLPASSLPAGAGSQAGPASLEAWLPTSAQSVLEALLMAPAELARRMQGSGGAQPLSQPENYQEATQQGIEDSGMKLAVLTCLARMLEIKCDELEGEGGTGPMERDQQILEAAKSLGGHTTLPPRLHSTILYRKGQKKLAREYLHLARTAIATEMECMRALIAEEEVKY